METNKGCGFGGIIVIGLLIAALFIFKNLWKVLLVVIFAIVVLMIIVLTVLSKKQREKLDEKAMEDGNVSEKIAVYRKLLSELMQNYYNIRDKEVKAKLKQIESATSEMLGIVRDDARSLDKAGRFLRTSLDGAARMMESYRRLEKAPEDNEEAARAKANAMDVLDKMITAFEAQTKRLYDNDILNMDVETEILSKTLDERWAADGDGKKGEPK